MIFIFPAILFLSIIICFCSLIGVVVCYAHALFKKNDPDATDYINTGTNYLLAFLASGAVAYAFINISFEGS